MQIRRILFGSGIIFFLFLLSSCSPKDTTTDPVMLREDSKSWIPYAGEEQITFYHDTNKLVFSGNGRQSYYENIRYMSDQSGFFTFQQDYYADMEREDLLFSSSSSDYYLGYYLEKGKGESGEWDILRVRIEDGDYYSNAIKIVTYQSDSYDKGEVFSYKESISLNGNIYKKVYYSTQERRPFELYYTKSQGIVAFKESATEIWTIDSDKLD